MAWRYSVENRFVFNSSAGIDAADVRALDQELAKTRAALIQSLSTGSQQLRQALLTWQVERSCLISNLGRWAKDLAQAQLNMKSLGNF